MNYSNDLRNMTDDDDFFSVSEDGRQFQYADHFKKQFSNSTIVEDFSASLKVHGSYSADENFEYRNDSSSLLSIQPKFIPSSFTKQKFVKIPVLEGSEDIVNFTGTYKKAFGNLCESIQDNLESVKQVLVTHSSQSSGIKFVVVKLNLSGLLTIPYLPDEPIGLNFVQINGITYVCPVTALSEENSDSESSEDESCHDDEVDRLEKDYQGLVGHGFLRKITEDENGEELIYCNKRFYSLLSRDLGPHKILFHFTTSCVQKNLYEESYQDMSAFIDLTCTYEKLHRSQQNSFNRHKMREYYFRSIIGGLNKVIIGFRNSKNVVETIKLYSPEDMRERGKGMWDPVFGFRFLENLLTFVQKNTEKRPGEVFTIYKNPRENIIKGYFRETLVHAVPQSIIDALQNI